MIELRNLLHNHFNRYPLMQVQDLYKLLHQAAMGSGHAIPDEDEARKWLYDEWTSLGDDPQDALLESISPDGQAARLNLRPCRKAGLDPELILAAFLQTAEQWSGSAQTLEEYGQSAARLTDDEQWQVKRDQINLFFADMEAKGFPAVHHSATYRESYRPAYRVVKTAIWRQYESLHLSP